MFSPAHPFPPLSLQAHLVAEEAEKKARDAAKLVEPAQPAQSSQSASSGQVQPPVTLTVETSVADIRVPKFAKWQKAACVLRSKTCVVVRQGMAALSSPDLVCNKKYDNSNRVRQQQRQQQQQQQTQF